LEYLRKQGRLVLPPIGIPYEDPSPKPIQPLTTKQIKILYQTTEFYEDQFPHLAIRDRAMLAVYYDCGLRRSEGQQLNYSDVHLDNRLLHVRKGKGNQQRFVPFSSSTKNHFESYLLDGRLQLQQSGKQDAFLLNKRGGRASGESMNERLKYLVELSEDSSLKQTPVHLHILRHSIATHLLYQGMELEKVAQFLGHRSLESTQIYTHLMEKVYG
jgi:integrase/recombinase XerD